MLSARQHRCTDRFGASPNHPRCVGTQRPEHDRPIRFEDSRLLAGDLRLGLAELVRMFEFDTRNAGDRGAYDVGRVEAPPEPDLDQGAIDGSLRKEQERHCGRRIEKAGERLRWA